MKTVIIGSILLAGLAAPLVAAAQQPPVPATSAIAYVSAQRLSTETTVGKLGLGRVQALQQQKTTELRAKQQALESTRQQLTTATDSSARLQLIQQEQQQRTDLERSTVQAQTEIQAVQRQAATELQATLRSELAELVKGTPIQIVVQLESAVVWAAPSLDLTSALIERINAKAAGAAGK